jgi:hypothetical protein
MEYELLLFINTLGVLTVVGIILYHFIGDSEKNPARKTSTEA